MAKSVLRPKKDGGYSECSAPDELVGKGRCCHILGGKDQPVMELNRVQRGVYEVKVNESTMTINAQKETIVQFFDNLGHIDENKVKSIIKYLNEEG